jgi:hypothetical protein
MAVGCRDNGLQAIAKILQEKGNVAQLQIAAPAQFMGEVGGDVLRPARTPLNFFAAFFFLPLRGASRRMDLAEPGRLQVNRPMDPPGQSRQVNRTSCRDMRHPGHEISAACLAGAQP